MYFQLELISKTRYKWLCVRNPAKAKKKLKFALQNCFLSLLREMRISMTFSPLFLRGGDSLIGTEITLSFAQQINSVWNVGR